uniref:Uncharacterized protein n=1 Tax=Arundo donax TaxID=35708 RepID=A0A0A8YUS7_ARUDO
MTPEQTFSTKHS